MTDHEKIDDCMDRILDYAEDSIPVLSEDKKILGVITSEDLIEMVDNEMGEELCKVSRSDRRRGSEGAHTSKQ
mgnify:CR=1 FL=1